MWVNTYVRANAAGSGASNMTITMPTNPDRTLSQVIPAFFTGVIGAGAVLLGAAYMFRSGSAKSWTASVARATARPTTPGTLQAGLLAGAELVFQGVYREA